MTPPPKKKKYYFGPPQKNIWNAKKNENKKNCSLPQNICFGTPPKKLDLKNNI